MVLWRRCYPALFQQVVSLPVIAVPAVHLPTILPQCFFPRGFHVAARLEGIQEGTLPLDAYNDLVKAGVIKHDQGQLAALQPLERLHEELESYEPPLHGLVSKIASIVSLKPRRQTPRGVYIYGGVGTGKTLVTDIFYHCSPVKSKQRVYFHQFMLDVQKRLHEGKMKSDKGNKGDVMEAVAHDLLRKGWLLCFDELQVLDIADAMILKNLLESLFKAGAVLVASSNRAPTELYKNGLNRELFLPCVELIKEHCHVHPFRPDAPDYRLIGVSPNEAGWITTDQGRTKEMERTSLQTSNIHSALSTVWYMPLNKETTHKLEQSFAELAGNRPVGPTVIKEGTRTIIVPRAAGGIAIFTFEELCGTPKDAAEYVVIAASFHTVFISGIPRMTRAHGELARQFVTLVDVLYLQRVKLIVSADADPGSVYRPRHEEEQVGPLGSESGKPLASSSSYVESDEEFAFARTVSRLHHMQSAEYLSAPWVPPGKALLVDLFSIKLREGDLRRIWDRYNTDQDSTLSREELRLMMEDLTEIKSGHRNVFPELVDDMYQKLDANHDGLVVWEEFRLWASAAVGEYLRGDRSLRSVDASDRFFCSSRTLT